VIIGTNCVDNCVKQDNCHPANFVVGNGGCDQQRSLEIGTNWGENRVKQDNCHPAMNWKLEFL
jgi:hypothetical protein